MYTSGMDEPPQTPIANPAPANGKKKPRGKPFTGKDDPRSVHNPARASATAQDVSEGPSVDGTTLFAPADLYGAMGRVLNGIKGRKKSPAESACQQWLDTKPVTFMERFEAMTADRMTGSGNQVEDRHEKPSADVGSERCRELIDKLLTEWEDRS